MKVVALWKENYITEQRKVGDFLALHSLELVGFYTLCFYYKSKRKNTFDLLMPWNYRKS